MIYIYCIRVFVSVYNLIFMLIKIGKMFTVEINESNIVKVVKTILQHSLILAVVTALYKLSILILEKF